MRAVYPIQNQIPRIDNFGGFPNANDGGGNINVNMLGELTLLNIFYPSYLLGISNFGENENEYLPEFAQENQPDTNWLLCWYWGIRCPKSTGEFLPDLGNKFWVIGKNFMIAFFAIALIIAGLYLLKNDAVKLVK